MEFTQFEIVLVSHDLIHWRTAIYCFPQNDAHRVAFIITNTNRVGHLECFEHIKKIEEWNFPV